MAGNRISVQLDFTANTSQAENALKSLQTSLNNISRMSSFNAVDVGMAKELSNASEAAIKLRANLQSAMDVNTGKLNLSKLNDEMSKSGMNLQKYATQLAAIGPEGRQAFMQLTNAIVASETPLRQSNMLVDKLWDTLKRTAGWQLSSSMIHGFMSGVQTAYNYAQDLNRSLNDIRIVTGYSADKMADFAQQANKAAKALSTTTTDYAKASLIYFQQGLNDQEVKERTDVTVKMANVTQTSAEQVSQQMTAVWNNFDDGSKSLEYYADVMTALGAATASSTDEIAEGLEKFAAVADTVGLSYEYATAALATVTATTRQSASVVGTAFKTLFARIEGLKLGETLDDGTSLNKYSEALASVGVNIKDTSGEMKQMDTILNETAEIWSTLSKDQQVALAQTVAGVRQYTQFIALMDNWDFMEENLKTVAGAEGELQKQADIYAESWEAAQKRVQAAAEAIYSDLLDDKFFIGITNTAGGFLEILDKVIDGLGGLGTILPGLIILVDKLFGNKIQAGMTMLGERISMMTTAGRARRAETDAMVKTSAVRETEKMMLATTGEGQEQKIMVAEYKNITKLQNDYISNAEKMSEMERNISQMYIQRQQQLADENIAHAKKVDLLQKEVNLVKQETAENISGRAILGDTASNIAQSDDFKGTKLQARMRSLVQYRNTKNADQLNNMAKDMGLANGQELVNQYGNADAILEGYINSMIENLQKLVQQSALVQDSLNEINFTKLMSDENLNAVKMQSTKTALEGVVETLREVGTSENALTPLVEKLKQLNTTNPAEFKKTIKEIEQLLNGLRPGAANIEEVRKKLKALGATDAEIKAVETDSRKLAQVLLELKQRAQMSGEGFDIASSKIQNFAGAMAGTLSKVSSWTQTLSTAAMGISMLTNAINTWQDPDTSGLEKISATLMSLTMIIPLVANMFKVLQQSEFLAIAASDMHVLALGRKRIALSAEAIATVQQIASNTALEASEQKQLIFEALIEKGIQKTTAAKIAEAVANGTLSASNISLTGTTTGLTAALSALWATLWPILLAAGAIAAVAIGIKAISDAYNADAIAAKEAAEQAQQATEAYSQLKQKQEELINTLKDYNDAEVAISKMKAGTDEWRDAVRALNEEVLALLKKYPELAKYVTNTNGKLTISKAGQDFLTNSMNDEVNLAYANNVRASIRKNTTQQTSDTTDAQRKISYQQRITKVDPITKAQTTSYESKQISSADFQKVIDAIRESNGAALQNKDTLSTTTGIENSQLLDAIMDNSENLLTLNDSNINTETANELLRDAIADNTFATSDLSDEIKAAYGGDEQEKYQEAYDAEYQNQRAALDEKNMKGAFNSATSYGKELFKQWADLQNGEDFEYTNFKGNKIEYRYMQDGEEKTGYVSYDRLKDELAEYNTQNSEIIKTATEQAGKNLEAFMQLQASQDAGTAAVGNILKGDINYSNWLAANSLTDAELTEIYNQNKENLKQLGYNTVEEFINGLREKIEESKEEAKASQSEVAKAYQNYTDSQNQAEKVTKDSGQGQNGKYAIDYYSDQDVNNAINNRKTAYEELTTAIDKARITQAEYIATSEGLDTGKIKEYQDILAESADVLDNVDDSVANNVSKQKMLATQAAQTQKGIETLTDAFKDYGSEIDASTAEGQRALKVFKQSTAQILNMSDELEEAGVNFSDAFIIDNLKDLKLAADNDTEAINRLHAAAEQDMFVQIAIQNGLDPEQIETLRQSLTDDLNYIQQELPNIEAGATIDDTGFIAACEDIINQAGMTAEQAEAYLASMGIDAEVIPAETKPVNDIHSYQVPKWGTNEEGYVTFEGTETHMFKHSSTGGQIGSALKVVGATKSSGGGVTYGKGGLGSGGGGKKSGSGGGGGGSKQKKKDLTKRDDVVERYHRIEDTINNLTKQYDKLSNATEHAFGTKKLKLMDQQIAKLKQMAKSQKDYLSEIEKYLAQDKNAVINIGAQIDTDGVITNYDQIAEGWLKRINDLENAYNAGSIDDDTFEERKKAIDEEKKILEQYEETYDKWLEKQDELAEAMAKIIQKELDQIQVKVDLTISETELSSTINDYMKEKLTDRHSALSAGLDTIMTDMADMKKQFDADEEAINKILLNAKEEGRITAEQYNAYMSAIQKGAWDTAAAILESSNLTQKEISVMTDYATDMMEIVTHYHQLREDLINLFNDGMASNNKFVQQNMEAFEQFGGIISHYVNVIDLLGKKLPDGKELRANMLDMQMSNSKDELEMRRKIYEEDAREYTLLQESLQKRRAEIESSGNQTALAAFDRMAEEELALARETLAQAEEDYLSSWEETLEAAQEKFENMLDNIVNEFAKSVAGMSFESLNDKLERVQDAQRDRYVADYKAIYEINKLNRDLQKSMDETTNIAAKSKLKALQNDINKEAGDYSKLTEHDLEYLQKQYEIQKAKIALEEAQNAKNTVRLRRDNEGNWGYVYTADEDNVSKAQEDYEKALTDMAENQDAYLDEMSKKWFETEQEFIEKYREVASDATLTDQEREEKLAELQAFYTEKLSFIRGELEKNVDRNVELYNTDYQALYDSVGKMTQEHVDLQTSFEQTIVGIVQNNVTGFNQLYSNAKEAIQKVSADTKTALTILNTDIDNAMIAANTSVDTFSRQADKDLGIMETAAKDAKKATEDLIKEIKEDYNPQNIANFTAALVTWAEQFGDLDEKASRFAASLRSLYQAMANAKVTWSDKIDYNDKMQNLLRSTNGSALGNYEYMSYAAARRQKVIDKGGNAEEADAFQEVLNQYGKLLQSGTIDANEKLAFETYLNEDRLKKADQATKNLIYQILRDKYHLTLMAFASGGLATQTGPAWLDGTRNRPELVLNPDDTKNFLIATEMLREIMSQLNFQANWMSMGATSLAAAIPITDTSQTLQQQVSIEATFPNVQDRNEIEEAFNNIINAASQYANRKD